MIVLLTSSSSSPTTGKEEATSTKSIGGKASSLAKLSTIQGLQANVPKSYALSTAFFRPWIDQLKIDAAADENACNELKAACLSLPLNSEQQHTLNELASILSKHFSHGGLAAVRSSAVEEDGSELSYAGMFETVLGVTPSTLERAVRTCFASKFDYRVFHYASTHGGNSACNDGFAVVVMEMVDAQVAGVAFSANPLNSDRDECVIDSSFGLGESVVDGSVTADRFIYDKVQKKLMQKSIGAKKLERRLNTVEVGGVRKTSIDDEARQLACSLTENQVKEIVRLTCLVEEEYGMPMDIEWAYDDKSKLCLLQARPITTLYQLDKAMMTKPGERRVLYYDSNITQDATTTNPFTHMDMQIFCRGSCVIGGLPLNFDVERCFNKDPTRPLFYGETRMYMNQSMTLKYQSPSQLAKGAELMCPYTASLFRSSDCDRDKYKMKKLPKGINLRNTWKLFHQFPMMKLYNIGKRFKKEPDVAAREYRQIVEKDLLKLKELEMRGYDKAKGLQSFSNELFLALQPSMEQEIGALMVCVLGTYKALDKRRLQEKTPESRKEYDALCSGFGGDELMEINIAVNELANKLGKDIWEQYSHDNIDQLAERIENNTNGVLSDLPADFVSGWIEFLDNFGWDRDDQMFISSPSYRDDPTFLLTRLMQNVGIESPSIKQQKQVAKRREVMKLHEERAASKRFTHPFMLKKVRKRNEILDNLVWIRNAPKLHISHAFGILRMNVLQAEEYLISKNMLEEKGDIFHLDLEEVDKALADESYDLMSLIRPRKAIYGRAKKSKECPILVDSRCRILRPDPPSQSDAEEGTLIGAAVAPGTATGRVRIVNSPTDEFKQGEILAAVVTNPAWTPLFAGASAVILQMGGALQHGALCAREYGKPAVSSIDIHNVIKTGMIVAVDGNSGTVKIIEYSEE
eukprot:CAMPEP_0183718270 /NCGR_PEP_ID=MMETSP0737-20130205/11576_1 /TAXON_ID=385413 /ORGANISM="Thalassiosira miniscula, Strain CCMP1093" /LENGTH=917 /DNA_ID=CAMNT_0025947801 /DNA_START=170 /DNA_END=2923 /DNA_ORIENTATION=+